MTTTATITLHVGEGEGHARIAPLTDVGAIVVFEYAKDDGTSDTRLVSRPGVDKMALAEALIAAGFQLRDAEPSDYVNVED